MPAKFLARSTDSARTLLLQTRAHAAVVLALWAVLALLALGYHLLVWSAGAWPNATVTVLYHGIVLVQAGLLWLVIAWLAERRRPAPARSFWQLALLGILLLAGAFGLSRAGAATNIDTINPAIDLLGFEYETGIPLTPVTVLKMCLLSLAEAAFAFLLLVRLRQLVLFKRTRRSERNWYVMVGLMVLASLTAFLQPAEATDDLSALTIVVLVAAVGAMVLNSFRLSWIVLLSFRQKLAMIVLTAIILTMLAAGQVLGYGFFLPNGADYLWHFSAPLAVFTLQTFIFGILYCTTAFLSLLFHLPTTGDFQQKVGEMAAIQSLTSLVSQVFDSEQLYSTIAASPVQTGTAQMAWLALTDLQSGTLRPRIVATHGITMQQLTELLDSEALYHDAVSRTDALVLNQAAADHRVEARPGDAVGSLLGLPLVARNETLGVLFIAKEVTHGFEQDDVEAIGVFAAQAALALDNARLFEEQLEKERLSRELAIAREVQQKLLPQRIPDVDGVSLQASSVAALEVGGDYYDFLELDDDRLALIVADVSGKGTSAAFYMAEMQGIFHSLSHLVLSPADFLAHANRALARSLERSVFISVIYGVLDKQNEELVLARAGHCPAATINLNGEARYVRTQGLGLGLDRGTLFERTLVEERISLQPGDVFVLYTDGIIESRNTEGEEYGYDRLLDTLQLNRHEDAADLHEAILADLHAFLGHTTYDDDMTLMVIKWHGLQLTQLAAAAAQQKARPNPAMLREKL